MVAYVFHPLLFIRTFRFVNNKILIIIQSNKGLFSSFYNIQFLISSQKMAKLKLQKECGEHLKRTVNNPGFFKCEFSVNCNSKHVWPINWDMLVSMVVGGK